MDIHTHPNVLLFLGEIMSYCDTKDKLVFFDEKIADGFVKSTKIDSINRQGLYSLLLGSLTKAIESGNHLKNKWNVEIDLFDETIVLYDDFIPSIVYELFV